MANQKLKYKRILLKISGEALLGKKQYGIDPAIVKVIAKQIDDLRKIGVEIAIVIGGGNIFRGYTASIAGMDRATADYMGMIATVMNALALQEALEKIETPVRVLTAISMPQVAEPYIRRKAIRHLEKGRIVICAAGSGNPYFSTDTAASLRALEINCDVITKATKVGGVFNKDPLKFEDAKLFEALEYMEILNNGLKIMDSTAVTLCMDNNLPMIVLNLLNEGDIEKAVLGEKVGTHIKSDKSKTDSK